MKSSNLTASYLIPYVSHLSADILVKSIAIFSAGIPPFVAPPLRYVTFAADKSVPKPFPAAYFVLKYCNVRAARVWPITQTTTILLSPAASYAASRATARSEPSTTYPSLTWVASDSATLT